MAERATIARPYARAAFAHSRDNASLDAWSAWLGTARAVVQSDEYQSLASSPGIGKAQLVELIAGVVGEALDAHGRAFLDLLAENDRVGFLPEIAGHFEELKAQDQNVADVQVVSAVALSEAQQQRLAGALRTRLQPRCAIALFCRSLVDRRRGRALRRPADRRLARDQARTARHRTDDWLTRKNIHRPERRAGATQACRGLPTCRSRLLRSAN